MITLVALSSTSRYSTISATLRKPMYWPLCTTGSAINSESSSRQKAVFTGSLVLMIGIALGGITESAVWLASTARRIVQASAGGGSAASSATAASSCQTQSLVSLAAPSTAWPPALATPSTAWRPASSVSNTLVKLLNMGGKPPVLWKELSKL